MTLKNESASAPIIAKRGTGMWPLVAPRPWDLTVGPGEAVLIDPVSVAACAADELRKIGWPGISLMDQDFQMSLIDKPDGEVRKMVEGWFAANRPQVCESLRQRLPTYSVEVQSKTARTAMAEAIDSYQASHFLSVVRVLLPEFETFARSLVDRTKKTSQKAVIDELKKTIEQLPVSDSNPIETFSLYHFIDDHLFAACFTEADAQAFGNIPNRHAELHGLASYGSLQGATTLLCVFDFLMHVMHGLKMLTTAPAIVPNE